MKLLMVRSQLCLMRLTTDFTLKKACSIGVLRQAHPDVVAKPSSFYEAHDDCVLPFAVDPLDLRGRSVRLRPTVNAIVSHYDYPPPVARLLGEATALTALLGALLESHGRFQLQTRSDGPVDMLVVDYEAPGHLRGFARFDVERINQLDDVSSDLLMGRGHLALTIEREEDAARYQGVVQLEGVNLAQAAHAYFRQSNKFHLMSRLAVGEVITPHGRFWRAGGLLLQHLPGGAARVQDLPPGDAPPDFVGVRDENENWTEGATLAATLEDHELIDPNLSGETILYRLFHERGRESFCRARCHRILSLFSIAR